MEAEFSKRMCQRLKEYEEYVDTCKSPMLQKDMVVVDRNELMALIRELKVFHSADQHLEDEGFELDPGTLQMTKEQLLKNAMWQARQMVTEAEVVRTSTLEDAVTDAKKEAERIMVEAKAYDAKVKAEAEDIVSMTLSERRQELETARKELDDTREAILEEARKEGEQILADVREEAEALRKRLDEEIEHYRKEKEAELKASMQEAQQNAMELLEQETDKALEIYSDTVYRAEEMVNLLNGLYEQQIEIIARDRQDIVEIIDKLERRSTK